MRRRVSRDEMEGIVGRLDDEVGRVLSLIWEHDRLGDQQQPPEDMDDLSEGLTAILGRLGLPSIKLLLELRSRWKELAGQHWGSQAVPIVVRHGVLLVEAADRRLVRRLGYDTDGLLERLERHFGEGFVSEIRVVSPPSVRKPERKW